MLTDYTGRKETTMKYYYIIKTTFIQENGKARFLRERSEATYIDRNDAQYECAVDVWLNDYEYQPWKDVRYDIIEADGNPYK